MTTACVPATRRRRGFMLLVLAVALMLRIWNAQTAVPNPDERHYASDGLWAHVELSDWSAVDFLRDHAFVHRRIDPTDYGVDLWPRAESRQSFLAHPALQAWLLGSVLATLERPSIDTAITWLRGFDAVADASVVVLLVPFVLALGGSESAALGAAALYAVFPPAVVYGSLANQDAFLAPLLLLTLLSVLGAGSGLGAWTGAGLWTGLAIAGKASGVVLIPVVAIVVLARRPTGWPRGLLVWGFVATAVVCVFVDPAGYARLFLDPSIKMASVTLAPWTRLVGNLSFLSDVSGYYLLSFWQHGEPWAPALARIHPLVTPLFHALWVAGLAALVARRRIQVLIVLAAPVLLLLTSMNPTDGMWRVHLLGPLAMALIAIGWTSMPRGARAVVLAAGLVLALRPVLPARPDAHGNIDLGNVLFANPAHHQRSTVYRALKGNPVVLALKPGETLSRTLWLTAGRYDVTVVASAPALAQLGSMSWPAFDAAPVRVEVSGPFSRLSLAALDSPSAVKRVTLLPVFGL